MTKSKSEDEIQQDQEQKPKSTLPVFKFNLFSQPTKPETKSEIEVSKPVFG